MAQKGYQNELIHEVAAWGYYDGAFHRENLRLGFADNLGKYYVNAALGAGFNAINSDTVPAGYVWIVTQVAIRYTGTSPTNIFVVARPQGQDIVVASFQSPTSNVWYYERAEVYLKEDEYLSGRVSGATGGDKLEYEFGGYVTDVNK
jgi:hypothetical protein